MRIGTYDISHSVFAAPMAGVTDRPYRILAKQLGAAYAVSEMVTAREDLRNSLKTSRRLDHQGESGPIAVQIAGTEPDMMAQAATYNLQQYGMSRQKGLPQMGRICADAR
jgi:tRNA-dihydrouridine synthase B